MEKTKKILKRLWEDESGQGAMEYILIGTVVVALILAFREKIVQVIEEQTDGLGKKLREAVNK